MQKSPEANKAITKFKLPVSITQPNRRSTKRVINPPGNIIIPFQSVVVSPVEILIGSYVWSQFSRLPPPPLLLSPSHWSSSSSLQLVVCCCCCCFTSSMCSSPRQQQLQRKHKTGKLLLLAPTTAGGEIVSAVHIILVARHIIPLSQYASASIPLSVVGRRTTTGYFRFEDVCTIPQEFQIPIYVAPLVHHISFSFINLLLSIYGNRSTTITGAEVWTGMQNTALALSPQICLFGKQLAIL